MLVAKHPDGNHKTTDSAMAINARIGPKAVFSNSHNFEQSLNKAVSKQGLLVIIESLKVWLYLLLPPSYTPVN